MNAKQNLIFFIGIILMVMVFWVNGYWSILRTGIGKGPGPTGPFVKGGKSKCPPGYTAIGNICLPPGKTIGPPLLG